MSKNSELKFGSVNTDGQFNTFQCSDGFNGDPDFTWGAIYEGSGGDKTSLFLKEHLFNTIKERDEFKTYLDSSTDEVKLESMTVAIEDGFKM